MMDVFFSKSENSNMFMPSLSYCLKTETSCNTQQTTDLSKQSQQTAQGPSRSSLPAGRFDGCFSPTILGIKFDGCFFLAWGFPHLVAPSNQFTVRYIYIYIRIYTYVYTSYAYIYIYICNYLYTSNLLQSPNIPSSFVGGLPFRGELTTWGTPMPPIPLPRPALCGSGTW